MDDIAAHMAALTEWVEEYLGQLDTTHYKCDIDKDSDCYAEQYGDGNTEDHWRIRSIKALLDNKPVQ